MISLLTPENGETVSLLTKLHHSFLADDAARAAVSASSQYSQGPREDAEPDASRPAPVCFAWEEEGAGGYALLVSRTPEMTDPRVVFTDAKEFSLYNLETGTEYFWCVQKNGIRSETRSFFTAKETPRSIFIDGIYNVRDAGGYEVEEGVIRQGLLYRGGEFEMHTHLTEQGARDIHALGLRTDLDLRGEVVGKLDHPTATLIGMRYRLCPARGYDEILYPEYAETTRAIFEVLADESAYPIYYHCWGGADRTGAIAYLLGAFLGMSRQQLIDDYEMTTLALWGTRTRNHPSFIALTEAIDAYEGASLREKARRALRDTVGMSDEALDTIYHILVERT